MRQQTISIHDARKLAVHAAFGRFRRDAADNKESTLKIISKLGYLQIDTLSVVRRAHEHTLWQRQQAEVAPFLDDLFARERKIFEFWGHAASYLPMRDYRFYRRRMKMFNDPKLKWEKQRDAKYSYLFDPILERIDKEGPLSSNGFHDLVDEERNEKFPDMAWGSGHVRIALDMMATRGMIMVTRRENFKKVFDLTERVLPAAVNKCEPDDLEYAEFFIYKALENLGIATRKDILDYIDTGQNEVLKKGLLNLQYSGKLWAVKIEGLSQNWYIFPDTLEKLLQINRPDSEVRILSPFDNFTILRERLRLLFDFDYALECYMAVKNRKFGYFVLPVFFRDQFIGRLDARADKKKRTLHIHDLYFEENFLGADIYFQELMNSLIRFARFCACCKIEFNRIHGGRENYKFEDLNID